MYIIKPIYYNIIPKRKKSDVNFILACNCRVYTIHALHKYIIIIIVIIV